MFIITIHILDFRFMYIIAKKCDLSPLILHVLKKYIYVKVSLKCVNIAVKYVRTAMLTDGKERFCIPGLCGRGKNHRDTF